MSKRSDKQCVLFSLERERAKRDPRPAHQVRSSPSKLAVSKLLQDAAVAFCDGEPDEDPRWFVAVANAMLTIEGSRRGRRILFPLNPWYLPEEVKDHLVLAGLATAEEMGLKE